MEYRQLGRSGLRISKLTMGTMAFGGARQVPRCRRNRSRGRSAADRHGARRRREPDRHGRRLLRGRRGGDRRSGACAARRDRVLLATKARFPMGDGPQRCRPLAPPSHPGLRGEPAPPRDRPHRPLPGPRVGRADAARGDPRRARAPPRERQGPLRRLLELRRLAGDEGARDRRRSGACRGSSASRCYLSLQERSAEYEIVPSAIDQGLGLLIWSPLAGGLLSGKYRRGQAAPAGSRHATRLDRAADLRRGQALRHDRGARRGRRGARRVRRRRSRWPGCSGDRGSRA